MDTTTEFLKTFLQKLFSDSQIQNREKELYYRLAQALGVSPSSRDSLWNEIKKEIP